VAISGARLRPYIDSRTDGGTRRHGHRGERALSGWDSRAFPWCQSRCRWILGYGIRPSGRRTVDLHFSCRARRRPGRRSGTGLGRWCWAQFICVELQVPDATRCCCMWPCIAAHHGEYGGRQSTGGSPAGARPPRGGRSGRARWSSRAHIHGVPAFAGLACGFLPEGRGSGSQARSW